ncbi:N-carbamoylputrescine amidase [Cryobacterium sp. MP_M5]|uniref:nitrilase-related carbon-nitrogen hydrolase n=1 Tax=unclassified Cryobacterium TaxID=2649013 RepID=UPI0018CA07C4|nr:MULTISPECIES: nitrilase-related carbon-nitrogen hydrolase [unclassified Cryobacterium]MBG6058594.1 N-carbamoylputrescine amidase [Cryobacterium sp. MP_M3]MEC5177232.1 N-carbamoylputrescine amidase [Cryobacterium sp. MP_M5]
MRLILAPGIAVPLTRVTPVDASPAVATPLRVALVQHRWHADRAALTAELADGIRLAAAEGARVVFLPELTLSRYPGNERATGVPKLGAEDLLTGPTFAFAAAQAREHGVVVHASLYERPDDSDAPADPRGYNTAILVSPAGTLLGRTRKLHIPVTEGYYEDTWFRPGPAEDAYPVYAPEELDGARVGLPTCWDEWFPEVSRLYGLAGAQLLVYPTAIGSEPGFPAFDTQPIWQHVIVGNGITSGLFMVVPNRHGDEGDLTFYGSSFISDPYGRVLVQAPRDESVVLVADLDLAQREEWLALFPFLATRRPDSYAGLTAPVDPALPYGAAGSPPGADAAAGARS